MAKLHGNRVELGSISNSAKNSLGSVPTGTFAYVSGVGLEVYDGSSWRRAYNLFLASGGTEDTSNRSGYKVHTFNGSGTLTVEGEKTGVEYLVIGGGGGGGSNGRHDGSAGGGGAGALRFGTVTVNSNTSVTVGGQSGTSSFGPISSPGGGSGNGGNGGSGGGAKFNGGPGSANGSSGGSNNSNSPSSGWGNPVELVKVELLGQVVEEAVLVQQEPMQVVKVLVVLVGMD